MKKILALIFGLSLMLALFSMAICAQQTNPQTNFPVTVEAANPSLWLNFNDLTTGFVDQVSGSAFVGTYSSSTSFPALTEVLTGSTSTGTTYLGADASGFVGPGFLSGALVCFTTAPASGQPLDIVIGASHTVSTILPVTGIATTSGCQTLVSGTNFTGLNVTAGQQIGVYAASGIGVAHEASSGSNIGVYCSGAPSVGGGVGCTFYQTPIDIQAIITTSYTSGTVTPRQAGFDATTPDNTSAAFPYNGFNFAPNNTLGAIDWNTPFSILAHVDRLNWNRTGTLVLASKGDISSSANPHWELYLQMSGTLSQLCFTAAGPSPGGPGVSEANISTCTSGIDAMPNGFNYDIVVTNNGSGYTSAFGLYLNGLSLGTGSSGAFQYGFGPVSVTVSGGTGYAATTYFTASGGGANCVVNGYFASTSGVPTGAVGYTQSSGCTSTPTIVPTAPTGSGATLTATTYTTTMNSTTYPLMVPGYVSSGAYYGVGGTNTAAGMTYVDEAAIFPGVLTPTQIGALFYQTKFYQGLLVRPATAPVVIFDDDGATDMDNLWALQETIALHKLGYLNLEGVVQENKDSQQTNLAFFRQELDQAGLANVLVGLPSDAGEYGGYNVTGINTFNASTLGLTYPTASQVYRQVMAANPSTPVDVMIGGEMNGFANFMASAADSISSLTGAQLFARNAANGGVLYSQGGGCGSTELPASTPCTGSIGAQFSNSTDYADAAYVYANGTAMPMIAVGGTPANGGPGPLATRTSKDPAYLQMSLLYGTDVRTAYDSLPTSAIVTPYFNGGVNVSYSSGGTGYAANTLFTSTGGGPNCTVTGYMTASGGVPNGLTTLWGAAVAGSFEGFGYGCTSAPTLSLVSPTGTGATLTAYALIVCGTASFPGYSTQSFASGTCSNQYTNPMSQWAVSTGSNAPIFTWFLNSLVDTPPQQIRSTVGAVVGSSFPTPPADAVTFNVQALPSTDFTSQGGACCGSGTDGSITVTYGNASPSLSGSSIMLSTTGESYNGQVFTTVCTSFTSGNCDAITDIIAEGYVYIPSSSNPLQGVEGPNVVLYTGTTQLYPSTQCATDGTGTATYNVWSGAHWISTGTPCYSLTGVSGWHHIQAHYSVNISAGTFTYDALAVDGALIYSSGTTYSGISDATSPAMKAQFQVDATSSATTSTYYIDNWKVYAW